VLSPVHTGDKVKFNTVDFVDKVDRVALAPYTLATKSTVSATVDFVASVYRALTLAAGCVVVLTAPY